MKEKNITIFTFPIIYSKNAYVDSTINDDFIFENDIFYYIDRAHRLETQKLLIYLIKRIIITYLDAQIMQKRDIKSYVIIVFYFLLVLGGSFSYYHFFAKSNSLLGQADVLQANSNQRVDISLNSNSSLPPQEVKETIAKNPPRLNVEATSAKIAQKTTANNDGSATTVFSSDSQEATSEIQEAKNLNVSIKSPMDVVFKDETGRYAYLGPILKNYLNTTLTWGGEIGSLKEIILTDVNVKDVGWCGLYSGSYNTSSSGKVTSVDSVITLNITSDCYQSNASLINDYMKLILSHEYGHHYTLYHKWVDLGLLGDSRFPDSYYSLRGLNKDLIATDYSKGWGNCESEIIAEDYSYFYSGYGYDGMSSTLGYPGSAVRAWLDNLKSGQGGVISDNPPTISISSPQTGQDLSGSIDFSTDVEDDHGVMSVSYYIDDTLALKLTNPPFSVKVDTTKFSDGPHTLKGVVSDGTKESETKISVNFKNSIIATLDTESPIVNFVQPKDNPQTWSGDQPLTIELNSSDNRHVAKLEFYINNFLVFPSNLNSNQEYDYSSISFGWPATDIAPENIFSKRSSMTMLAIRPRRRLRSIAWGIPTTTRTNSAQYDT